LSVASHHAHQHAFAHAGAGKNPQALSAAARQHAVDAPHARTQRHVDPRPLGRCHRTVLQVKSLGKHRLRPPVDAPPAGVDHAAEQRWADLDHSRGAQQPHRAPPPHAVQVRQRHDQRTVVAKADHLGLRLATVLASNADDSADRRRQPRHRDRQPGGLHHAADHVGQ
jgi:hypothetical protein